MIFRSWAAKWGVPFEAVLEYERELGIAPDHASTPGKGSESRVQSEVMLEGAHKGYDLFRNNVGSLPDESGRWVRYGLCNDSPKLNEKFKSGDLIGPRRVTITQQMVGSVIGQFCSVECKPEGWTYTGTGREPAQLRWAQFVISAGGYAAFVNRKGLLP